MSKNAIFAGPVGVLAGGAVAIGLAVAGVVVWNRQAPPPQPVGQDTAQPVDQDTLQTPQPDPQPASDPQAQTTEQPVPAETPVMPDSPAAPQLPEFALVRVEADGLTQVAGRAAPGDVVDLLIDDTKVGEVTAGRDGSFATILDLPPSDAPRLMRLRSVVDGTGVNSEQEVIIAPSPKPVADATVETAQVDVVGQQAAQGEAPEPDTPVDTALPEARQSAASPTPAPLDQSEQARDDAPIETVSDAAPTEVIAETSPNQELADAAPADAVPEETPAQAIADTRTMAEPEPAAVSQTDPGQTVEDRASVDAPAPQETAQVAAAVPSSSEPAQAAPPTQAAPSDDAQPAASVMTQAPPPATFVEPATGIAPPFTLSVAPTPEAAAPAPPAVLLSDSDGVRVMQPGRAPEVMDTVAIDAITYSDSGDVALAGRSPGQGFVRIYLDNTPITTSRIAVDGSWRSDLPQVDSGIYTLRVDQVDAQGAVVSRVETPFKREAPAALAAASAGRDAAAQVITVQPGFTLWAIARDRYGEGIRYVEVFNANRDRIRDPDLIYPGQVFDLPDDP